MTNTLADDFTVQDAFPPVGYEQWRTLVEASLHGASFERKLVTHTYEGIDLQPIYTRRDQVDEDALGLPGYAPFVRGSQPAGSVSAGWDLRQEHAHPDLETTNRAIREDLAGGTTSLLIRFDDAARQGFDPDAEGAPELAGPKLAGPELAGPELAGPELAGRGGLMAYSVQDLATALAGVDLKRVGIMLEAGAAFQPAAAMLAGLWRQRQIPAADVQGAFNADPLAALARNGHLPVSDTGALDALADLARWTADNCPRVTSVGVNTMPYHDAGASAAQDIAFGMATAVEYLRALTARHLDVNAAARQILFRVGLGTHHFLSIAKLRAARKLWSRIVEACGGDPAAGAMRVHARTSNRVLTQRDVHVNLLRNAVAVFSAGLGGADAITSVPFDAMTGLPDSFSRRVARNTVLVLQEESHLHRVIDPAGGSWFLDRLTEQLAGQAWDVFQQIERQDGMLASLRSGWIAEQIDAAYAPRAKDIARRKEGITGVSEFPDIGEQRAVAHPPDLAALQRDAIARIANGRPQENVRSRENVAGAVNGNDFAGTEYAGADRMEMLVKAASQGATIGQLARTLGFHAGAGPSISPLEPRSFAQPFEELRNASDAWQATRGHRPRVFLANMGPVAHHSARAAYSKNFFEAGGFEVLDADGPSGAGGTSDTGATKNTGRFADTDSEADSEAAAFAASGAAIAVICSSDELYVEFVPRLAEKLKQAGARSVLVAGRPGDHEQAWRAAGVDRFIFVSCDVLATLRELLREEGVFDVGS